MKIDAVIVDFDRTLLHTDKTISPYTADVLRKCREHGIRVMAATARPLRTTEPYSKIVEFDAMAVSNGARVICGEVRTEYGIAKDSAVKILQYLSGQPGLRITAETGDCAYSNLPIDAYETVICRDLSEIAERERILKILVTNENEETLRIVREGLTEDVYCTLSGGFLIQIMSRFAAKWNGVRKMLELCRCLPENAVYFGDDYDDIEPIRMCGMGIAVANAIDEVKAAADAVAGSNDEDGAARFLEQLLNKSFCVNIDNPGHP